MGVELHNQTNKSQNPSQTQQKRKMLEFGANPPTHLCTQAPPPPPGGGGFCPLSNSLVRAGS